MSRCTEYVPTAVEIRSGLTDEGPRHIVSSTGPAGVWTLCGQWIPIRRLRILKVDREAGTMRVRDEDRRIEGWEWSDCHRACAERHLLEKRRYRIGSGPWTWFWQAAAFAPVPVGEPLVRGSREWRSRQLAEISLSVPTRHSRLPWWRRLVSRKEKAA